jgi:hypothetical protein
VPSLKSVETVIRNIYDDDDDDEIKNRKLIGMPGTFQLEFLYVLTSFQNNPKISALRFA